MRALVCTFCGWRIYLAADGRLHGEALPTQEHPCCRMARERGEERCGGCVDFVNRMERGEVGA